MPHPQCCTGNSISTLSAGVSGADAKVDAVLITALDETAWLFNLRGNDVDFNPVFVSYGIITAKEATLFVDPAKVGRGDSVIIVM